VKTLNAIAVVVVVIAGALPIAAGTLLIGGLDGASPNAIQPRAQVAMALSGGGARGLATIGLLKAFEENGIAVSAIAGTSMGGIIGGLYACGYSPDDLEHLMDSVDFSSLFSNRPVRSSVLPSRRAESDRHLLTIRFDGIRPSFPQALIGGQKLTSLLSRLTIKPCYLAGSDFTKLPIPFKATATDIISGRPVILSSGSLSEAMRATMAFPLAITGVERDGQLLMDGGMLYPLPVEIAAGMVDSTILIVGVNTSSPLEGAEQLITPVDIAGQVTTIMTSDKLQREIAMTDITVAPVSSTYSSTDFKHCRKIIQGGYEAGKAITDSIVVLYQRRQEELKIRSATYRPDSVDIICPDTALAKLVRAAELDRQFTEGELTERLKAIARWSGVFQVRAVFDNLPAPMAERIGTVDGDVVDVTDSMAPDRTPIPVRLTVWVYPDPPLSNLTFNFYGNRLYDDLTLVRACNFPDSTVSATNLRRSLNRIVEMYRADGHDLADIRRVSIDPNTWRVDVVIDEALIVRMNVTDNARSKDWLIRSYFPLREGVPCSTDRAIRGLAELYGTDLFDQVSVDLKPSDQGALMTVSVKERKYTQVRLGWHWHDEYQSEEYVELVDDNIAGIGLESMAHAQYGRERSDYHTQFRLDRIFFSYLTARARFFYTSHNRNQYLPNGDAQNMLYEQRWGAAFYLGQHIARLGTDNRERFGLRTLYFESLVETLDRVPFPRSGSKTVVELRLAGKLIGGETEFTRFTGSIEWYYTLASVLTIHPKASLGLSRRGLPFSEKFYLGGMDSFSGFRTNELSGDKFFLFNQEVRLNLPLRMYLLGRWDIGDVYTGAEYIRIGSLRHGFGAALAYDSPIGPLEFGYGGGDSPRNRVYLHVGYQF
jgi:NTE family protein